MDSLLPQHLSLTDRLLALGRVGSSSGYKTSATAMPDNPRRLSIRLRNENTVPLFVKLGADDCSASDFHVVLKAATGAKTGDGGELHLIGYTERISVFSSSTYGYTVLTLVA